MLTLALVWGILAFAAVCVALLPCLGWLNWFTLPFAAIGVVLGVLALSQANARRQPAGPAVAGIVLSTFAVCLGLVRLVLGGGIF